MAYVPPLQGMSPEEFRKKFVPVPPKNPTQPVATATAIGTPTNTNSVPMPPTGVGGYNYGTDTAKDKALVQNIQLWNSNPAAKAAEIARTQQVIAERQKQGLDVSAQQKHLTQTLGYTEASASTGVPTPPDTGVVPSPVDTAATGFGYVPDPNLQQVPAPQPTIPAMDEAAIRQHVEAQIARKLSDAGLSAEQALRAAQTTAGQHTQTVQDQLNQILERLTTGAQQAQQGIQTSYDRERAIQQDERNLQNVWFDRSNSPFSGRTEHDRDVIGREREITDRQQAEDLGSRIANINQELALQTGQVSTDAQTRLMAIQQDLANIQASINEKYQALQNAAPEERERLYQEIKNDERNYELMLRGELRNDLLANSQLSNADFQRQLSEYGANRSAYEFDKQYELNQDQFNREFDFRQEQQDWENRFNYGQAIGQFSNGQQTLQNQMFQYQKAQQEWENAFREGQFDFQKAQQIWDNNFKEKSFQQGIKDTAAQLGLNYAQMNQTQQRFVAEMAFKQEIRNAEDSQRNFESEVMGGLSQFDNADEASAWLNANAGEITRQLGQGGFTELKNAIPVFYGIDNSQANAKDAASLRSRAVEMASKDSRWGRKGQNNEDLVNEYMRLLQ